MERHCEFVETMPKAEGGVAYCCGVAVNFYAVGEKRELCRICPISAVAGAPHCRHLEFYASLRAVGNGRQVIEAGFGCCRKDLILDFPTECGTCPDYRGALRSQSAVPQPRR